MTWRKAIYSVIVLLLLVAFVQELWPLSSEEKAALPGLDKEALIQIILIYDQSLTDLETEITSLQESLTPREEALNQKEEFLNRMESILQEQARSLSKQEELSETLYESSKKKRTLERILDWLGGSVVGYGLNEIKQLLE